MSSGSVGVAKCGQKNSTCKEKFQWENLKYVSWRKGISNYPYNSSWLAITWLKGIVETCQARGTDSGNSHESYTLLQFSQSTNLHKAMVIKKSVSIWHMRKVGAIEMKKWYFHIRSCKNIWRKLILISQKHMASLRKGHSLWDSRSS